LSDLKEGKQLPKINENSSGYLPKFDNNDHDVKKNSAKTLAFNAQCDPLKETVSQ
jgi:hypothetical protein